MKKTWRYVRAPPPRMGRLGPLTPKFDKASPYPQDAKPSWTIWEPVMKTTIEIADDLAESARAYAARERITFRSLIERALRELLRAESQRPPFTLRDASVGGRGL